VATSANTKATPIGARASWTSTSPLPAAPSAATQPSIASRPLISSAVLVNPVAAKSDSP